MITPIEPRVLRKWRAILLLKLPMEVMIVLFQVYYHHSHIVLAVVVGTSLVCYLLRYFVEGHALFPVLINHFRNFFFGVDEIKTVR